LKRKKNCFLKKESVPSIFNNYPPHLQRNIKKRKEPIKRTSSNVHPSISMINHDHSYYLPTQKELKRRLESVLRRNCVLQKKLKAVQQKFRDSAKRCVNLNTTIDSLREKILTSDSVESVLKKTQKSQVPVQLFQRLVNSQKNPKSHEPYSKEIKSFALTLQFYSNKAFNFVRETFGCCLPHESTVRDWYTTVKAEAGFTSDSFDTLKRKVEEEELRGKDVTVSLVFDEVSI